jgi:hypothetical protein
MKRNLITILSLVVGSLMFGATGSYAQSYAQANVPFAFTVGQKQLPAGPYQFKVTGQAENLIIIRNIETGESVLSIVLYEAPRSTESKLVFDHVGNEYFLTQVWRESGSQGQSIPTSRREQELTKELLLTKNSSEKVTVALN